MLELRAVICTAAGNVLKLHTCMFKAEGSPSALCTGFEGAIPRSSGGQFCRNDVLKNGKVFLSLAPVALASSYELLSERLRAQKGVRKPVHRLSKHTESKPLPVKVVKW